MYEHKIYMGGYKSSKNDVKSTVEDFFAQWDTNTAITLEEVRGAECKRNCAEK